LVGKIKREAARDKDTKKLPRPSRRKGPSGRGSCTGRAFASMKGGW
jgi:hypothetical protein